MTSVLVIDDDRSTCDLLRHYLEQAGYAVTVAADGSLGLGLFEAKRPEVVVVDIFMPQKDGIETILDLRGIEPGVRILAISGGGDIGGMEYLSYAKVLGADAILSKPFTRDELIEAVGALASGETT